MRGLSGLRGAETDYTISPDADIDSRFRDGQPGTYVVRMVVEGVKLTSATRQLHSVGPYNDAFRAQGVNATATAVKYVGNRNQRSANWAQDFLSEAFYSDEESAKATGDNAITDMVFDVTVNYYGDGQPGVSGFGAITAGAVFAIVAVVAVVLAVTFPGFGKMVLEAVKFVGRIIGEAVGGAANAVAENAIPLLLVAGVAAAAIFLIRKGGGRYSKSSGFSFGG